MASKAATIRVSPRGNIAIPSPLRRELGLHAGDSIHMRVEGGELILTPEKPLEKKFKVEIIKDSLTGWPVLTAGPDAPILTSEEVAEMLADFP